MARRLERVNELLRDELSQLLMRDLKDPRLGGMVSLTKVDSSPDFRHARVFVSIMGTEEERRQSLLVLRAASAFLRHELAGRLTLRRIPELHFQVDSSIEIGANILQLMKDLHAEANPAAS